MTITRTKSNLSYHQHENKHSQPLITSVLSTQHNHVLFASSVRFLNSFNFYGNYLLVWHNSSLQGMTGAAFQYLYFTVVNSESTKNMTNTVLNESTSDKSFMSPREILGCYKRSRDYRLCPPLGSSTIRFFFACTSNSCQISMKSQVREATLINSKSQSIHYNMK